MSIYHVFSPILGAVFLVSYHRYITKQLPLKPLADTTILQVSTTFRSAYLQTTRFRPNN